MSVSGSVSRGKYRQIFIRKRRDDEEEEEDNGDSVDATLTGKEGSPRKPPVLYRIISCPTDWEEFEIRSIQSVHSASE